MIKLPARSDGQWTVTHNNDKLPDITANRNLTFDKEGYMRLSKPVTSFYSSDDDANFGVPIFYAQEATSGAYYVLTTKRQFELDMYNSGNYADIDVQEHTATNSPINTSSTFFPGATFFGTNLVYLNPTDRNVYYVGSTSFSNSWSKSDLSASLESDSLPTANFTSMKTVAVGNDNQVDQFDSGFTVGDQLSLSNDLEVTGLVYNNGYLGITTHHKSNSARSYFFVWDGKTSAVNYGIEVPSTTCYSPIAYRGTFAFLAGNGVLYYWNGTGIDELASLPPYFSDATMAIGSNRMNHTTSVVADGDVIYINMRSLMNSPSEDQSYYLPDFAGGVWAYDPPIGLYHRHSPSAIKAIVETVLTSEVSTADDEITVTNDIETGTPVRYSNAQSTTLAGLVNDKIYYAIRVDATTVQLAETLTLAEAGTAIDLTGTGNNAQTLQFYPKTDFGQSYIVGKQGAIQTEGSNTIDQQLPLQTFLFGSICSKTSTTEVNTGNFVLKDTENRGYFVTAKFQSSGLQDDWKKLFLKHKILSSDLDKIVIKYRTIDDGEVVKISTANDGLITWSDNNTFTSTDTQFANVIAGDEVEIIQGTGSGYLAHVSSISEAGGTYTVNIDEDVKNLTAATTGRVVVSRWTKQTVITKDTVRNSDGYSEIPLGVNSKIIQFKIELRGQDIEIEELLLDNAVSKSV